LNLMVFYIMKPLENPPESALARLEQSYRTAKLSMKIPILPSVSLRYSFMKNINVQTQLGLLVIQNLSKNKKLAVQELKLMPSWTTLDSVISGATGTTIPGCVATLEPLQSSNLVLRISTDSNACLTKRESLEEENRKIFLYTKWQLQEVDADPGSDQSMISGLHKLLIRERNILPSFNTIENPPVVFQVRHTAINSHDFNTTPCFVCPVELIMSCNRPGKLMLHLRKAQSPDDTKSLRSAPSHGVYIVGKTSWTLEVQPLATEKLVFHVALARPGVYNIGPTVNVTYVEDGADQVYQIYSPLILNQAVS